MDDHGGPVGGPQLESPSEGIKAIVHFLVRGERMEDASGFLVLLLFSIAVGTFGGYLEGWVFWLALAAIGFEGGLKLLRYWVSAFDGVKCSRILSLWEAYHGVRYALVVRVVASAMQGVLFTAFLHFVLLAHRLDLDIPKADHFSSSTRWVLRLYETLIACCVVSLVHFMLGIWVLLGTLALWLITGQGTGWSKNPRDHRDLSLLITGWRHISSTQGTSRFQNSHRIAPSKNSAGREFLDQLLKAWRNRWMGQSQRSAITLYVHARRHPMLTGLAALESDACGLPTNFTARWDDLWATLRRFLRSGDVGVDALAILDGIHDLAGDCKHFRYQDWSTLEHMCRLAPPDARQRICELMAEVVFQVDDLYKWREQLTLLPESLDWAEFLKLRDSPFYSFQDGDLSRLCLSSLPKLVDAAVKCSADGPKVVELRDCPELKYFTLSNSDIRTVCDEWSKSDAEPEQADGESDPSSVQCHLQLQGCPAIRKFTLLNCKALLDLGNGICRLEELQILNLYGCCKLKELPHGLRQLRSLKVLILAGCSALCGLETEEWLAFFRRLHTFDPPLHLEQAVKFEGAACCDDEGSSGMVDVVTEVQPGVRTGVRKRKLMEGFRKLLRKNQLNRVTQRLSTWGHAGAVFKLQDVQGLSPKQYSLSELLAATNNFHEACRIGSGSFGRVYRAMLQDGSVVAVKKLVASSYEGLQLEYVEELKLTAKLHHRNVVALRGYCIEANNFLLIYDYMENRSLRDWIFGTDRGNLLEWSQCVDILVGTAKGIVYLHDECRMRVIHRDIKPANILLDKDFAPCISDFGLAKSTDISLTHVTTRMMGTLGYMDPSYFSTGQVTDKADVYSFGVLVAVVISRSRPFDRSPFRLLLLEFAEFVRDGRSLDLVSQHFLNAYDKQQAWRLISIVLLCTQMFPVERPPMAHVVQMLTGNMDIPTVDIETYIQRITARTGAESGWASEGTTLASDNATP